MIFRCTLKCTHRGQKKYAIIFAVVIATNYWLDTNHRLRNQYFFINFFLALGVHFTVQRRFEESVQVL
jgi:hypothetical protein